jgi:hypothetical protein
MKRAPTDGPAKTRDDGTTYQGRPSRWQSGRSTRRPGVMPRTGGRAAGLWERPRSCGGDREPSGDKRSRQTTSQAWRAVCYESSLHGVRREARCDIPAAGRRNEERDSWVTSLPGRETGRGQEQTGQAEHARKRCRAGLLYDPLAMGRARLPEL